MLFFYQNYKTMTKINKITAYCFIIDFIIIIANFGSPSHFKFQITTIYLKQGI